MNQETSNSSCYLLLLGQEYCSKESSNDLVAGRNFLIAPASLLKIISEVKFNPEETHFGGRIWQMVNHLVAKFKLKHLKNIRKDKSGNSTSIKFVHVSWRLYHSSRSGLFPQRGIDLYTSTHPRMTGKGLWRCQVREDTSLTLTHFCY